MTTTPVAFDFREESEGHRHRPANRPGVPTRKTTPWCVPRRMAELPHRACAQSSCIPRQIRADGGCSGGLRYFKGRQDFRKYVEVQYYEMKNKRFCLFSLSLLIASEFNTLLLLLFLTEIWANSQMLYNVT